MTVFDLAKLVGIWSTISTGILAVAWIATKFVRHNAAHRHLIWVIAFASLLVAPLAGTILPGRWYGPVEVPVEEYKVAMATAPLASELVEVSAIEAPVPFDWTPVLRFTLALWAGGIGAMGARAVVGIIEAGRMRKQAIKCDPEEFGFESNSTGIRRRWELRVSTSRRPPAAMTWGSFLPVVMLPKSAPEWTQERASAVIRHELAHVRRFDSLTQLIALLLCAIYWFNPFVWLAARALRAEAEKAADDGVILSGMKPSEYAAELLRLASEFGLQRQPLTFIGVSVMKQSQIESRIQSIVDPNNRRRGIARLEIATFATAGLVLALALVAVRPALAQEKPPIPPLTQDGKAPKAVPGQPAPPSGPAPIAVPGQPASPSNLAPKSVPGFPAQVVEGKSPVEVRSVRGYPVVPAQEPKNVRGKKAKRKLQKKRASIKSQVLYEVGIPAQEIKEVHVTGTSSNGPVKIVPAEPAKLREGKQGAVKPAPAKSDSTVKYRVSTVAPRTYSSQVSPAKASSTVKYRVSTVAPRTYSKSLEGTTPAKSYRISTTPSTYAISLKPPTVAYQVESTVQGKQEVEAQRQSRIAKIQVEKAKVMVEGKSREIAIQKQRVVAEQEIAKKQQEEAKGKLAGIQLQLEATQKQLDQLKREKIAIQLAKKEADTKLAMAKNQQERAAMERKKAEEAKNKRKGRGN